jgi:hypothetical protein
VSSKRCGTRSAQRERVGVRAFFTIFKEKSMYFSVQKKKIFMVVNIIKKRTIYKKKKCRLREKFGIRVNPAPSVFRVKLGTRKYGGYILFIQ